MSQLRQLNILRVRWKKLVEIALADRVRLDNLIAIAKDRLETIENWKVSAITKFDDLEARVSTLETKASLAQTKFQQIDTVLADFESRITALEP